MGKSLSQTLGLKDPLDNAIHSWIKPGAQPNNYQAPPWWGPVTPSGMPAGAMSGHAALPSTGGPAGLPPTVRPPGAPPPASLGFTPPPLVDGRLAHPGSMAPMPAPPAALAAGIQNLAPAGQMTRVNGVMVPAGQALPPGTGVVK